jgi:hypothetical protein
MIQDTEITNVEFYYHEVNEDLFAYFPDEIADVSHNKMSYSHIGQHSSCSLDYVKECRKASQEEYQELFNELENSVGYKLKVV